MKLIELLARARPTVFDTLIAVVGVGLTRAFRACVDCGKPALALLSDFPQCWRCAPLGDESSAGEESTPFRWCP